MVRVEYKEADFARLIDSIEDAVNDCVIITKAGKPIAKIEPMVSEPHSDKPYRPKFWGIAEGLFEVPPPEVWEKLDEEFLEDFPEDML
ncbi:MAG: hypothetical protein NC078_00750 [Ruminococcus sp.]|nr:hypothetical protein [Ruminococcus sp.]